MSIPVVGESMWFHHYETDHYEQYPAIVRVVLPSDNIQHGEIHLSWFEEDVEHQENTVKNVEDTSLGSTEDYWRRRYSPNTLDRYLSEGGLYETVRVEKGDMVVYRPWTTNWIENYYAVVVATLGSPTDEHPAINIRYVNDSGDSTLVSGLEPFEKFAGEEEAEGNDVWCNNPNIQQSA